jgi:hypothetical protein
MGYQSAQPQASSLYFCEGSNGDLAAAAEFPEESTLAGGGGAGGIIIKKCDDRPGYRVTVADFDCQGALSRSGGHRFYRDHLTDQLRFAQAIQAGGGKNDSLILAGFEFAQARVNIAAQRVNLKILTKGLQLGLTAQAAGANVCLMRQRFNAGKLQGTKNVARIFARGDGGNFEIDAQFRGQIFQAVHGKVNTVFGEGFFDFLREHALGANFGERNIRDFIARRLDNLKLYDMSMSAEEVGDVMGLPESELRTAGTDAETGHQSSDPLFGPDPRVDFEAAAFCSSVSA